MRILVTGSRDWPRAGMVRATLESIIEENCPALYEDDGTFVDYDTSKVVLIHGNCPTGADRFADDWATDCGIPVEKFDADWRHYGIAAGHIRNDQMIKNNPDICVAFIHNNSRGAISTVKKAEKAGIPVRRVHSWNQ